MFGRWGFLGDRVCVGADSEDYNPADRRRRQPSLWEHPVRRHHLQPRFLFFKSCSGTGIQTCVSLGRSCLCSMLGSLVGRIESAGNKSLFVFTKFYSFFKEDVFLSFSFCCVVKVGRGKMPFVTTTFSYNEHPPSLSPVNTKQRNRVMHVFFPKN